MKMLGLNNHEDMVFKRASRWITLKFDKVTQKHSLWDFTDENGVLIHFKHGGREYAIGQFLRINAVWYLSDGTRLIGYDGLANFRPYYLEIDNMGERVRIYEPYKICEEVN